MLTWTVVGLGLVAGLTIFLGLPFASARRLSDRTRAAFSALAVGVLLFLFVDVLSNAHAIVLGALGPRTAFHVGSAATDLGFLILGFSVGVLSLLYVERGFFRRVVPASADPPAGSGEPLRPLELSTVIAVGIGLHNLSEGLAIGASYAAGLPLAFVLVIGFAAHNTTEGFGILAPGMMAKVRYSGRRLLGLGFLGGGPTFVGTLVGSVVASVDIVSVLFYGLAAGAILYVVLQMSRPMLAPATREVVVVFVVVGFLLGLLTDFLVTLGGL
jgi:ZIP family zinc transporter